MFQLYIFTFISIRPAVNEGFFCAENDSIDNQSNHDTLSKTKVSKKEPSCATESRFLATADATPLTLGHNSVFDSTIEKPETELMPSSPIIDNKNSGFITFKKRETDRTQSSLRSFRKINNVNSFVKQEYEPKESSRTINVVNSFIKQECDST